MVTKDEKAVGLFKYIWPFANARHGSVNSDKAKLTFTFSKSTIETLEKGVSDVVLVFLLLTFNIFHTFF